MFKSLKANKFLALCTAFLVLVGCSSGNNAVTPKASDAPKNDGTQQQQAAKNPERTSLKIESKEIVFWNPDVATWQPLYEQLIKEFENMYPEIKVKIVNIPQSAYFEKLNAAFAAKTGPDVWVGWYAPTEYDIGYIEPLDEYIKADNVDMNAYFQPVTDRTGKGKDGKRYAMPRDVSMTLLAYNKELFKKYSVDLPKQNWTIDEFDATVKKLTHPEDGVYGTDMANVKTLPGSPFIWNMGGDLIDDTGKNVKGVLDSEGTINAFKYFQKLKADGTNVPKDILSAMPDDSNAPIQSGKVGLSRAELYGFKTLSELKFDWGVVSYPYDPKMGKDYGYVSVVNWLMNAKSNNKNEAWALMKFLSSEKAGNIVAEDKNWMPAQKQVWIGNGWDKDERLGVFYEQGNKEVKASVRSRSNMYKLAVETPYKKAFTELVEPLKGTPGDPATVLKNAAEEAQKTIDKEMK